MLALENRQFDGRLADGLAGFGFASSAITLTPQRDFAENVDSFDSSH